MSCYFSTTIIWDKTVLAALLSLLEEAYTFYQAPPLPECPMRTFTPPSRCSNYNPMSNLIIAKLDCWNRLWESLTRPGSSQLHSTFEEEEEGIEETLPRVFVLVLNVRVTPSSVQTEAQTFAGPIEIVSPKREDPDRGILSGSWLVLSCPISILSG